MDVAAAVLGIGPEANSEVLTKAVRGFSRNRKQVTRVSGTGVVHFISNKFRLVGQRKYLDGDNPSALLIPVMTLTDAKSWSGQAYSALFVMGLPSSMLHPQNDPMKYISVQLNTDDVMNGNVIEDATSEQIEQARSTLIYAVLALRSLLANMDNKRIQSLGINQSYADCLTQARDYAKNPKCWFPQIVDDSNDRKPLCLVKFGEAEEEGKHPPPDPLLLAYKAAAVWAKMTKEFRLLANGEKPDTDDDTSEEDYNIAEVPYFDACNRSGNTTQQFWAELAVGLGQSNGYEG
jgi:hypothetical protein